jgi:endonuclease YncB( thermonuclease family)
MEQPTQLPPTTTPSSNMSSEKAAAPSAPLEGLLRWEDTVEWVFPITEGQVIKVYDGDTITIAARLPYDASPVYRLSVRLNGIDTPEIKSKNAEEKQVAKQARDYLASLILHKTVSLRNVQTEKYGRILANVYLEEICVNERMVEQRFAVRYDGGTKQNPESWMDYNTGKNCK